MGSFDNFEGGERKGLPARRGGKGLPALKRKKGASDRLARLRKEGASMSADAVQARLKRGGDTFAIALDATASMTPLIDDAKASISEILKRVFDEAKQSINIQIFVYRDYDVEHIVLESSSLTSDPAKLLDWLSGVEVCGGGGNEGEAIEKPLEAILHSGNFHAVILAGDEPANKETLRERDIPDAFHWAEKLGDEAVNVHTFVVGDRSDTERDFKRIAELTGGKSGRLDGSQEMIDMAVMAFLSSIKGRQSVLEYSKKYKLTDNSKAFANLLLEGPGKGDGNGKQ